MTRALLQVWAFALVLLALALMCSEPVHDNTAPRTLSAAP